MIAILAFYYICFLYFIIYKMSRGSLTNKANESFILEIKLYIDVRHRLTGAIKHDFHIDLYSYFYIYTV